MYAIFIFYYIIDVSLEQENSLNIQLEIDITLVTLGLFTEYVGGVNPKLITSVP